MARPSLTTRGRLHLRIRWQFQGNLPAGVDRHGWPATGADAALGTNVQDGAKLAVDVHNAANPGCQVQLKTFDTEGDPQKATQVF